MFIKIIKQKNRKYAILVESYKTIDGKSKHKPIYYFGAVTESQAEFLKNVSKKNDKRRKAAIPATKG